MIIGIDPGLSGAWAVILEDGSYIGSECFSRIGDTIDTTAMNNDVDLEYDRTRIVLERVHAMPKNGSLSAFKLGTTYGQIIGYAQSIGLELTTILPSEWKKRVLSGLPWKRNKDAALEYVINRYPNFERGTNKAKALARAEAVCIALSVLKG